MGEDDRYHTWLENPIYYEDTHLNGRMIISKAPKDLTSKQEGLKELEALHQAHLEGERMRNRIIAGMVIGLIVVVIVFCVYLFGGEAV
jgi:hypothetical protein